MPTQVENNEYNATHSKWDTYFIFIGKCYFNISIVFFKGATEKKLNNLEPLLINT
jgi:hypothetical protein